MLTTDISTTQKTLLSLLADALFSQKIDIDEDVNWSEVWKESYMQAVSVLAFSSVDHKILSDTLLAEIRLVNKTMISKSMQMNIAHAQLDALLKEIDVPYVILKGFASGKYYPDYLMRSMGDIDFLVYEEDVEKASDKLISLGFEMSHENHDYHRVFSKGLIRYEMHVRPSGIPQGEKGEIIQSYLNDAINDAKKVQTAFGEVSVPSAFHHGLIILVHTAHHLTSGGVGLRHLCDWAVFVNSMSEDEFLTMFESVLKETGLWHFACVITKIACDYLGCPQIKWADEADSKIAEEIIKDVFKSGNFGQKDETRSQESLFISTGKSDENKSSVAQLFTSMNKIVYQKWKIARTLKFLLPIGWIFFGGRYIIRALMGKRPKLHPMEAKTNAEKRMMIYDELKLYR